MTDIARKIDETAAKLATGVTVTEADIHRASRVVFSDEIERLQEVMEQQAETIHKMEAKLKELRQQQYSWQTKGQDE